MARSSEARRKLGRRIRRFRKDLNISQEKLAELVGVHRTYIGAIERAEESVSVDNLAKIAKALKVKPSELLD